MSDEPEDFGYELGWIALGETLGDDDGEEAARAMGVAIVGCEEMQAIKAVLLSLASLNTALLSLASLNTAGAARIDVLRLAGLPETVIDWVFS